MLNKVICNINLFTSLVPDKFGHLVQPFYNRIRIQGKTPARSISIRNCLYPSSSVMFIAQSYKIVNLVLFPPFLQNFSGSVYVFRLLIFDLVVYVGILGFWFGEIFYFHVGEVTSVNRIPTAAAIFGTKSIERYKYFSPISSDSSRILYEVCEVFFFLLRLFIWYAIKFWWLFC